MAYPCTPPFPADYIDVSTEQTLTLTTTATVQLPEQVNTQFGITYNVATGIFTLPRSRVYQTVVFANPATGGSATIYTYAQISTDGGATWVGSRRSARQFAFQGSSGGEVLSSSSNFFNAGTMLRFPMFASSSRTLVPTTLTTGNADTEVVQSLRFMITGA